MLIAFMMLGVVTQAEGASDLAGRQVSLLPIRTDYSRAKHTIPCEP